jgi:hypothetical protein
MEGPSVSRGFLTDLRNLDPRLGVKWNGFRHIITFDRGWGEPVNIHQVKNEDGSYRPCDQRDIAFVAGGDLCKEDMKSRLRKLSMYSEKIREKARADARDNIKHMTADSRRQLANMVTRQTNQGKGNSTFRRIDLKRKESSRTWTEIKAQNEG